MSHLECLDGLDEEQLIHIIDALMDTARRSEQLGMMLDAKKKRITAQKVMQIKQRREELWLRKFFGGKEAFA